MTTIDGMAAAVGNVMCASAVGTMGWLFPSMLVLGGIIAYATRNNGGEGMFGNLLWLIVAGTALIFTSMNAVTIVNSVRSEEHTSELQSRGHLVCRLLLEKKKSKSV